MIIDAFTYFGSKTERDILEFRMKLLWEHVDRFVIVECDHTFSGKKKPWNFEKDNGTFDWAYIWNKDKIIYHKCEAKKVWDGATPPDRYDPYHPCWVIEKQQRDAIIDACKDFADDDYIMIGDLDEIPMREAVEYLKLAMTDGREKEIALALCMFFFYYNLTNLREEKWNGTIFTTLGHARAMGAQNLRDQRNSLRVIWPGGIHMSYLGGVKSIQDKIEAFSHQELNKAEFKNRNHLNICLASGEDLFKRGGKVHKVGKEIFPPYFVELARNYNWGI